jgi:hypothetical protein
MLSGLATRGSAPSGNDRFRDISSIGKSPLVDFPQFPGYLLKVRRSTGRCFMEKGEKQERRRYTQEFKLEAIRW